MVHGHHCRVAKHPKISEIIQIIVLLFELYILKHIINILKPIICYYLAIIRIIQIIHIIASFDRHYMPDGVPAPEASVQGNAEDHRADLKRKADGISRSLSDVFYLPHMQHYIAERSEETFDNHP